MLLAVAGLKEEEIRQRTRKLAIGDWSDYSPAEARAFSFAHRLTKEPEAVSDRDVSELTAAFGDHRAVDLIWYTAWCNYMTRVADAFQLPLERDNVFAHRKRTSAAHPRMGDAILSVIDRSLPKMGAKNEMQSFLATLHFIFGPTFLAFPGDPSGISRRCCASFLIVPSSPSKLGLSPVCPQLPPREVPSKRPARDCPSAVRRPRPSEP